MSHNIIIDKDKTIRVTVEPTIPNWHEDRDYFRRRRLVDRIRACIAGYERDLPKKQEADNDL